MMKTKIFEIVINAVNEINQLLDHQLLVDKARDCELYGESGLLDSISLVTLIVKVEEKIENEFNVAIILASEKAMSQRRSPFLTIGALCDYIETIISGEVKCG